jgi:release factor glutamine methyltransferase
MLIRESRAQFIKTLSPIYDVGEIESFFYLILENKYRYKRLDLALNPELSFTETDIQQLNLIVDQLKKEIPIQYILGTTVFLGMDFEVNKNVLIPRPETEELAEWIITNTLKKQSSDTENPTLKILDIGTGSGCIAVSLAKNIPNATVFAIDISEKALITAEANAQINNVKVTFLQKNILETTDLEQKFDIIVSNPPYVRNLEKVEIKKNVLEYEPHLALFVEDHDALLFYRKIADLAQKNLSENGYLYFEINQYLGNEMIELLEKLDFNTIELRKDIYGNDRMIKAALKSRQQ